MTMFKILVPLSIVILSNVVAQQYEGDSCTVNNGPGVCIEIQHCPEAVRRLQRSEYPITCGFNRSTPIVCCSNSQPNLTRITEPSPFSNRRAYQNCLRYSQYVYEWVTGSNERIDRCSMRPPIDYSYIPTSQKIIVGNQTIYVAAGIGFDADPRHFTHMAILGYGDEETNSWACGGSLISEHFIITAGHCTNSRDLGPVRRARVGDYDISRISEDAQPQDFNIIEIINHNNYKPPLRYNDIALLRLDKPAVLSYYIIPACLGMETVYPGINVTATGWGKIGADGDASSILQQMNLELYRNDECNLAFAGTFSTRTLRNGIVDDTQLCAGNRTHITDTCQGDSGGPLQMVHPDIYCMHSVVGITSFGFPCGNLGVPGIYTRLSPYVEWIENIIWP